jgi:hypothetical protein
MTPQEFSDDWIKNGGMVSPIDPERLLGLNLKEETIDFLTISGLPVQAPPFLSFAKDTDDYYEGISTLTKQYDFLAPEFTKFVSIGYDAGGNPIVINTDNDQVEWLDQENEFSSRFMNSSITHLTEFLIIYRDFILNMIEVNGEEAYQEAQFTDEQFAMLKEKMIQADSKALDKGFWKEELEHLLANREEHLHKDATEKEEEK